MLLLFGNCTLKATLKTAKVARCCLLKVTLISKDQGYKENKLADNIANTFQISR